MPKDITINLKASDDQLASMVFANFTLLSVLISDLQDQGVLTEEAVGKIYDRAIDALAIVDAENPTEQQRLSSQAAAFLRGLAPNA